MAGQLDAVWGSRRLSLADIHHAYRLLHHSTPRARQPSATSAAMLLEPGVPVSLRPVRERYALRRSRDPHVDSARLRTSTRSTPMPISRCSPCCCASGPRSSSRPSATSRSLRRRSSAPLFGEGIDGAVDAGAAALHPLPNPPTATIVPTHDRESLVPVATQAPEILGGAMRFLIFDMDGVLVIPAALHARAYQDLWERCGIGARVQRHCRTAHARKWSEKCTRDLAPSASALAEWVAFKQERAREYLADRNRDLSTTCFPALEAPLRSRGHRHGRGDRRIARTAGTPCCDRAGIAEFFRLRAYGRGCAATANRTRSCTRGPVAIWPASAAADQRRRGRQRGGYRAAGRGGDCRSPAFAPACALRRRCFWGALRACLDFVRRDGVAIGCSGHLIIPAAGRGSRLQSELPKVALSGCRPGDARSVVGSLRGCGRASSCWWSARNSKERCARTAPPELLQRIEYAIQERPDGMLPAILWPPLPLIANRRPKMSGSPGATRSRYGQVRFAGWRS